MCSFFVVSLDGLQYACAVTFSQCKCCYKGQAVDQVLKCKQKPWHLLRELWHNRLLYTSQLLNLISKSVHGMCFLTASLAGTASGIRPDGQAAAAQQQQQDLLGDLLDLNEPAPAPPASSLPPAAYNNTTAGVQDLLGRFWFSRCSTCMTPWLHQPCCFLTLTITYQLGHIRFNSCRPCCL